jgi:predicted DNA-binding transcriptional regulator AlpA
MELVDGEDLSQWVARGAIPIDEALPIAKQIAEALEAAEEEVLACICVTRVTIWRKVRESTFPAPIRIAVNRKAWRWSAIQQWIADRETCPPKPRSYFGRDKKVAKNDGKTVAYRHGSAISAVRSLCASSRSQTLSVPVRPRYYCSRTVPFPGTRGRPSSRHASSGRSLS